jgi:hypothetical protein
MQDVEMVLRFFYLFESSCEFSLGDSKNRFGYPTKEQLNSYMRAKKEQEKHNEDFSDVYIKPKEELEAIFNKVCQMVKLTFRNNQFKKFSLLNNKTKFSNAFNKAFFDIQMLGFVDYEIEDITGITDVIYNEFIELCYFNTVMMDNTNEKISERINTWKDLLSNIVNAETDFFLDKLNRKIEHFNTNPICLSCSEKIEELNEGYLDLENNAFYHVACYIKENKVTSKRNAQAISGGKLLVTFLDSNEKIYCDTSTKTFIETLQIMGLDNVANLGKIANGHPLVSHERFRLDNIHQRGDWYIDTLSNTNQKKSLLEAISKDLNIPIQVEIV